MLVLGVEHWRIEENLACLLCYSKLGLNESTQCYGKLSAAVFSDEFGAKFAGECQLKINLYSVYGLPVTVAEGLYTLHVGMHIVNHYMFCVTQLYMSQ